MTKIRTSTFLGTLFCIAIVLSFVQRLVYVLWILAVDHQIPGHLGMALGKGLLFDISAAVYSFLPIAVFVLLIPRRLRNRWWFTTIALTLTLVPLVITSTAALGEIFFFQEFHARYNFIAVDYLIYTTEVVRNVEESYSPWLLAAGFIGPALIFYATLRSLLKRLDQSPEFTLTQLLRWAACALPLILCVTLVSEDKLINSEAYWPRELSKNSLFTLFTAYHHNSIDYHEFYVSLDSQEALKIARTSLQGQFTGPDAITRSIQSAISPQELNVVLVVMESLSAGFMQHYGNRVAITPNLDKLADSGLFYSQLYATGTRTVRGLEALMLSLPPTPGQSILRRPNSDHLFNLGTVFAEHGYKTQFIYGGYAYFDNMQEWYEGNGFEVVDHSSFPADEIQFSNAWGVCDEDLFNQVLKQQQQVTDAGKHFFQVVLTTSNHRPYTFPEGKIDIPPHSGREGALKYSDYSIGKFLQNAESKPWFKDTLFVFVADHDASVAGGSDIPVHDFLIPAIFYNPLRIPPQNITKLASQIDIAPTLLGLLNFSYTSKFFGEDLQTASPDRAVLGTYQKVALLKDKKLTILSPGHAIETQDLDETFNVKKSSGTKTVSNPSTLSDLAKLTISLYQTASEMFVGGQLKTAP